jgi:hypothetical protein
VYREWIFFGFASPSVQAAASRCRCWLAVIMATAAATVAAAEPICEKQVLFPKEGATVCRIPSLVVTKNGVVLATADRRIGSNHDWGHDTEIILRRSVDGGRTWLPTQVLASEPGVNFHSGPSLVDAQTGRVFKFLKKRPASFRSPGEFHTAILADADRWRRWGVGSYVIHSDDAGATWSATGRRRGGGSPSASATTADALGLAPESSTKDERATPTSVLCPTARFSVCMRTARSTMTIRYR